MNDQCRSNKLDFEEDPRYKTAGREAIIALLYWVAHAGVITVIALSVGYNKTPNELDFIWGLPSWFFWSGIVATLVFCVAPYFIVKYLFTDMSLEAVDENRTDRSTNA